MHQKPPDIADSRYTLSSGNNPIITAKINYRKKDKFVYHSSVFALQ